MAGFKILVADDTPVELSLMFEWLKETCLDHPDNTFYKCAYIKKVSQDPDITTFDILISDPMINVIDIAFVDLVWDTEGFDDTTGGEYIISELLKKFKDRSLIIPISQIKHKIEKEPVHKWGDRLFNAIAKFSKNDRKTALLYSYLERWQLAHIQSKNDLSHWRSIYEYLKKNEGISGDFKIDDRLYFANIPHNNIFYFKRVDLISALESMLGFTFPKGIGYWANKKEIDLVEVYKRYMDEDRINDLEKTLQIEDAASKILRNRVKFLENPTVPFESICFQDKEIPIRTIAPDNYTGEIPFAFYCLLIWRRVILGICKIADEKHQYDWKSDWQLAELFYRKLEGNRESTLKRFFSLLGFSRANGYISNASLSPSNCFPEENVWRDSLTLSSLLQ